MCKTRLFTAVVALALYANVWAVDVVGKWTGKMEVTNDKGAKVEMNVKNGSAPSLVLNLKSDGTYAATQTGGADNAKRTAEGKWKLSGSTLTLNPLKRDGKPATGEGAKPRIYTLSKDGKTLTLDLSGQLKAAIKTDGTKAVPVLKAKMVLRKAS